MNLLAAEITARTGKDPSEHYRELAAANGWFAARPSGAEDIYKIYAESCRDQAHLDMIVGEAQSIVNKSLSGTV